MALILCIDTAMEAAGVCLTNGGEIISFKTNSTQSDHAAWVHIAIKEALADAGSHFRSLDAVAVTAGPGSYTGLRVGMATAKGLCYVMNIPLITISTLHLIAVNVRAEHADGSWICPMIDARRMEVFTTLYDDQLQEKQQPSAVILDENSFGDTLIRHKVIFAGNGSTKFKELCHHPNAAFSPGSYMLNDVAAVASEKFKREGFSDIAYAEPLYLKSVYTGTKGATN